MVRRFFLISSLALQTVIYTSDDSRCTQYFEAGGQKYAITLCLPNNMPVYPVGHRALATGVFLVPEPITPVSIDSFFSLPGHLSFYKISDAEFFVVDHESNPEFFIKRAIIPVLTVLAVQRITGEHNIDPVTSLEIAANTVGRLYTEGIMPKITYNVERVISDSHS